MTLDRTYFLIIFGIVLRTRKSEQKYRWRNLLKDITDLPVCVKFENCAFFPLSETVSGVRKILIIYDAKEVFLEDIILVYKSLN